jgi:hypothetical protein
MGRACPFIHGSTTWGAGFFAVLGAACAPGHPPACQPDDECEATIDAAAPAAAAAPAGADARPPGPDARVGPGAGAYLDRCAGPTDCQSELCVVDVGGAKLCSKPCAIHEQCAHEHFCVDGVCQPDDTGTACSIVTPDTCGLGLCLGNPGGTGACTRPCGSAADCPAGYACTLAGGTSAKVCVDIEKACSDGTGCGTGLCLTVQGCTATCDSVLDCPARLTALGLPPYPCEIAFGSTSPICKPPADVLGPDPIGAICRFDPGTGGNLCRSGACDDAAPIGPMCTQACTAQGGCGPGLGCYPLADGGMIHLVCVRAGTGDLGDACAAAADCHSALCDAPSSTCTRLCHDGLCPTGWTCQPVAGTSVSICRP